MAARPATGKRMLVEFVSANPTGPLHVGHGRQAALGDAICNLYPDPGLGGATASFITTTPACRSAPWPPAPSCAPRASSRATPAGRVAENAAAFYNGDYIADIAADFLAKKTVQSDDREFTASGDVDALDDIRQFAVAYLRHEQDLDLKAFAVQFDNYYLESQPVHQRQGRCRGEQACMTPARPTSKTARCGSSPPTTATTRTASCASSDGSYTYFVPDVAYHISQVGARLQKVVNIQGTDHHGTIARVRAGLQAANVGIPQGYPDYVLHTMVRVVRGGEEVKISKRAGSYVTLRDLIEWTSKDAVRFFLLSRKPDTEYTFDVDLAVAKNNDNPVYYVQYAHARICSVLASLGRRCGEPEPGRSVAAAKPASAGADAAAGQIPRDADGGGRRFCAA